MIPVQMTPASHRPQRKTLYATGGAIFLDDYETGTFASQNGYSDNDGNVHAGAAWAVTTTRPHAGSYSAECTFTSTAWEQLDFHFGSYLSEFWMEYMLYVPANYSHVDTANDNNKFFIIWRDVYSGPCWMNWETIPNSLVDGGSAIQGQFTSGNTGSGQFIRDGVGGTSGSVIIVDNFIQTGGTIIVPGNWAQIRVHVKSASGAATNDGVAQMWVGGVSIYSKTDLELWFKSGSTPDDSPQPTFHNGYILGATNSFFQVNTTFHVDTMKIYNTDPGW